MNARRLILFGSLVVAAWLALFGDKTPSDPTAVVAVAVDRRRADGRSLPATASAEEKVLKLEVAALIPRAQLIPSAADGHAYRDLFAPLSWAPPPPRPERSANPPPAMAPPLPFVYLGKKLEAGQWEAYLGNGEQVFIVREGMTLAGIYKVKAVRPPTLTLIYLPLKQSQTIPIGGSP